MKKKILILVIEIIVLGTITVFLYINFVNKSKAEANDRVVTNLITEINEINKIFTSTDLSDTNTYELDDGRLCREYLGSDKDEYLERLNNLYSEPFFPDSYFDIVTTSEDETKLYICQNKDTKLKEIKDYQIMEESDERKKIQIIINEDTINEYFIIKENDTWKFSVPVVIFE